MRDVGSNGAFKTSVLSLFKPKRDPGRYLVDGSDVLFLARGNRNRAFTTEGLGDHVVASSHFFILTPDLDKVRPGFLAWYLNTRSVRSILKTNIQGTTMKLVPRGAIESVEIDVPPLVVQERIVELAALRERERELIRRLEKKWDALVEGACTVAIEKATSEESTNV